MRRTALQVAVCGWAVLLASAPVPAQQDAGPWVVPISPEAPPKPADGALVPTARLEVLGPESANVGQPIEYRILISNPGPVALHRVRVEDELAEDTRYLGGEPVPEQPGGGRLLWELGTLEPGAEHRIRVRVRTTADGELRSTASVTFSASTPIRTPITRPRLTVRVDAAETAVIGSEAVFPVEVRNAGTGPANHVALQVRLPDGLSHPAGDHVEADLGTLAAGASRTVTLRATAQRTGPQSVEAFAYAEGGLRTSSKVSIRVTEPALEVRATCPATCPLGENVTLAVEASNPGTAATDTVHLRVRLPDGMAFVSADGATFEPTSHTAAWTLPTLAVGQTVRRTCELRAVTLGAWPTQTHADAGRLSAKANCRVAVVGVASPALEVGLDEPLIVGHEGVVVIRAVNHGSGDCSAVQIRLTGDGLDFLDVPAGTELALPARSTLAVGADALFRVRVRPSRPGPVTLRAELRCGERAEPIRETITTRALPVIEERGSRP